MADADAYQVRSIDRLIAVNNYGDDLTEANNQNQAILDRIAELAQEHDGIHKGKLALTIEYAGDRKGLDITITSKATLPGRPKRKERFFLTRDNHLTMQDPGRDSLFPGVNMGRASREASGE